MADNRVVRLGILGAAWIAPAALIRPARKCAEASVEAIAARDPARARRFARKHGITRVHDNYKALLDDPDLDAVYIALPNSHHALWTERALRSGKHVLCEKPLAANSDEAELVSRLATDTGLVLCEAMHYRFHPVARRMKEYVESGKLGRLLRIEAYFCTPPSPPGNIRLSYELAGGATMDVGCYLVDILRYLGGQEPEVTQARAALASKQVDRWMKADFRFPNGCLAHAFGSIRSIVVWKLRVNVLGEDGSMHASNPFVPHLFGHRLLFRDKSGTHTEKLSRDPSYDYQLRAFVNAVLGRETLPFGPDNAVANMRLIDKIYAKAGLERRVGELA